MNINASITINRDSNDVIHIRVMDEASRVRFIDVSMTPEDFAMAITGLSEVKAPAEVRGLEHVGKTKIVEQRATVCHLNTYDKAVLRQWLEDNHQEPGWILDAYLGSQNSVTSCEGGKTLRYRVFRYESQS